MVEINWTVFALKNLNDIGSYIAKDSVKFAEITVESLFSSVNVLKNFPLAGRVVPEFGKKQIREIIQGNYRIVYRLVSSSQIDKLTVHHSKKLFNAG